VGLGDEEMGTQVLVIIRAKIDPFLFTVIWTIHFENEIVLSEIS